MGDILSVGQNQSCLKEPEQWIDTEDFLRKSNYLGEFSEEVPGPNGKTIYEKAMVRDNLDVYSKDEIDDLVDRRIDEELDKIVDSDEENRASDFRTLINNIIEQAIQNYANTANQNFVKKDGSTPFTNPQRGVKPTQSYHLATKGYVDRAAIPLVREYLNSTEFKNEVDQKIEEYANELLPGKVTQLREEILGIIQQLVTSVTAAAQAANGALSEAENKIEQIYVGDESVVQTDQQGKKYVRFSKDQFGKVDGIRVNDSQEDLPVNENGKVSIPIPTTVAELSDAEDYATKEYVTEHTPTTVAELTDANDYATKEEAQAMVDESKVNSASLEYEENGGSPNASVNYEDGDIHFTLENMKMKFSELTTEERLALKGDKGNQGDSVIVGEGDLPLANYVSQANDKAVTPKAVYDELMIDRTWSETAISSQNSGASDRRYISSDVWKSESSTTQGAIFPVTVGKTYKLIAASGNIYYAFVTAKSTANNDPVSYAGGATGLSSLSNGESVSIVAPSDAMFLYTSRKSSSTVVLPTVKEIETTKEHIASIDASVKELEDSVGELVEANLSARIDEIEEEVQGVDDAILDAKTYEESNISYYSPTGTTKYQRYINSSNNTWVSGTSTTSGAVFPVEVGKTYKVVTQDTNINIGYAFVQEAGIGDSGDPVSYANGVSGLQSLKSGKTIYLVAPPNSKYLYTSRVSSSTSVLPTVSHVIYNKEKIAEQNVTMTNANEILPLLGLTDSEDITSDITWAGNGYVSIDQIVVSSSSITHYSTPIHLAAGECIIVQTRVNTSLMVLTEDTGQNSVAKYNVLVKGMTAPETGNNTYAYIAPRDMNVVISTFKSSDCFVTIRRKQTDMEANLPEKFYLPPRTYNILAAYDNLVAIGDSLTKGVVYTIDGSRVASRPYPKVLQKTCGFDNLSIWAEGGKNAEYIWATFSDQFAIPQTGKTLCIVFLGTNGGFTDTLDTEAPVGDEDNWDMTKRVPCYAKIIKTFVDFGANILLIKPWTTGTQDVTLADTFATIDGVAERYGCAVIKAGDIKSNNFKYHCYPTCNGVNLLHFNELGYAHFASAIINAVNELPDNNLQYLVPR